MFDYQKVKIAALTQPLIEGVDTADDFIAYAARVSNPDNQLNKETSTKLLRYLIRNNHWSPFEMVSVTMEVKTTRDIGRQILRHRSFSFQEFSQRYAVTTESTIREARLQDNKNRQNSIDTEAADIIAWWADHQEKIGSYANDVYREALKRGIAKEQARAVLPEGLTMSTLYMAGTLRSWIHYCALRMANGTQKEHMDIACKAWDAIQKHFPSLSNENIINASK